MCMWSSSSSNNNSSSDDNRKAKYILAHRVHYLNAKVNKAVEINRLKCAITIIISSIELGQQQQEGEKKKQTRTHTPNRVVAASPVSSVFFFF